MGRRQIRRAESASAECLAITSPITSPILLRKASWEASSRNSAARDTPSPDSSSSTSSRNGEECMSQSFPPPQQRQPSRDSILSIVSEGSERYCRRSQSLMETCDELGEDHLNNGDSSHATYSDIKPHLVRTLNPQTKFDKLPCVVNGLRYSHTGDLLLSDCANKKVKLFDYEGQLKVECCVPESYGRLDEPAGLCQLKTGQIVVADKQAGDIKVFTSDGMLLTTFGKDLQRPRDVCTTSWGHVVVVDEGLKDILLYRSLMDKGVIHLNKGTGKRYLNNPGHGTTVKDDCILATDSSSAFAALFDCFGNHLSQLFIDSSKICSILDCKLCTSMHRKSPLRNHPHPLPTLEQLPPVTKCKRKLQSDDASLEHSHRVICNDRGTAVLVTDYAHSCVVRLDLHSDNIHQVILNSHHIHHPVNIASHPTGLLAVQEYDSSCIKIYRYLSKT